MSLAFLGYIAAFFSLIGIILNANKTMACWPVWIFSNILWIIYSTLEGDIPSIILWILFSIFNVYGWVKWKRTLKKENKELWGIE